MRGTRLTAADAVWLAVDGPRNRSVVTAVLQLDRPVELEALRGVVADRLVHRYPRLSQRAVRAALPGLRARWVADAAFDVRRHVRSLALPGPLTQPALQHLVGDLMSGPLAPGASPWELHVVQSADDSRSGEGGAVVARFHHSLADGRALAELLLRLTDDVGPGEHPGGGSVDPPGGRGGRAGHLGLRQAPGLVLGVVRTVLEVIGHLGEPRTALRGRLGTAKTAAWSSPHSLDDVRRAAEDGGASVNDVLLAALAGGLRRDALRRGEPPRDVRVVVPVDLRAGHAAGRMLGNRFGVVLVRLPVSRPDRRARLQAVVAATDAAKRSQQPVSTYVLLQVAGALGRAVSSVAAALLSGSATAVVTNVPGPRQPLSLVGRRLTSVVFWVPQLGRVGVGISIFSYAGTVTVGVASDARLALDPEVLVADVDAEISALAAAAG